MPLGYLPLDGKVTLISGTARGMGQAAALEFTAQGAAVFGCDLDKKASAETVGLVEGIGAARARVAEAVASFAGSRGRNHPLRRRVGHDRNQARAAARSRL